MVGFAGEIVVCWTEFGYSRLQESSIMNNDILSMKLATYLTERGHVS